MNAPQPEVTYTAGRYIDGGPDVEWETRTAAGPFYHGGRGRVAPGRDLTAGRRPNSWGQQAGRSTHVWFTQSWQVAADTAAACERETGRGFLYEVAPSGHVELDTDPASFKTTRPVPVVRRLDPAAGPPPPDVEPDAEPEAEAG